MSDFPSRMRLARQVVSAARDAGASTELHRRSTGQIAIGCHVAARETRRYFEILV